MNLYVSELLAGAARTLELAKQGENIFDMGNHAMFPTISSQAKWRFARKDNTLHLSDGTNVYSFHVPRGESTEQDFPLTRIPDLQYTDFETGATAKGPVQVHRADPGSIYFTIQEGHQNPTYTFRHEGGDNWRGIPKKKASPKSSKMVANAVPAEVIKGVKAQLKKKANIGTSLLSGMNNLVHGALLPGYDPAKAALAGGLGGAAYHFGRRALYNTPEENAEEGPYGGMKKLLFRAGLPAAGLGVLGMTERGLLSADRYNEWSSTGMEPKLFGYGHR